MISALKSLLTVALIASLTCSAYGLKCYSCDVFANPKCGEKFDPTDEMKFDCLPLIPPHYLQTLIGIRNATGCMKKVLDILPGIPGNLQIIRSCYYGDITNTQTGCQSDPTMPYVPQLSCDVCTSDLCNGDTNDTAPISVEDPKYQVNRAI